MATHNTLQQLFTSIANSIRTKNNTTGAIKPENFATEISKITTGINTSDATVVETTATTSASILSGYTAYGKSGKKLTGTATVTTFKTGTVYPSSSTTIQVSGLGFTPKGAIIFLSSSIGYNSVEDLWLHFVYYKDASTSTGTSAFLSNSSDCGGGFYLEVSYMTFGNGTVTLTHPSSAINYLISALNTSAMYRYVVWG